MTISAGEQAPDFEALFCSGETFRSRRLGAVCEDGGVLVFSAFAFSAIARNWWVRYERARWQEFDVPVVGVSRDGPYAQNAFIRTLDSPFVRVSDTDGTVSERYELLTERDGMANTSVPRRAVFVFDSDRTVTYAWVAPDWISPVPRAAVEAAVDQL